MYLENRFHKSNVDKIQMDKFTRQHIAVEKLFPVLKAMIQQWIYQDISKEDPSKHVPSLIH